MKPQLIAMIFGFALTAAPTALADEDSGIVYGNLHAAGSGAASGATDTSENYDVKPVEIDGDQIAGAAGVLEYSFGRFPFRTEVEVAHRIRFDIDAQGAAPATDIEGIPAAAAPASAIVEWRNDTDFTPFAGVTAGWAWNVTDTRRPQLSTRDSSGPNEGMDKFAYGGVLGLDWGFRDNWSAGVVYRYLNLGGAKTSADHTTESVSVDDYVSHDVLLSIFYRF